MVVVGVWRTQYNHHWPLESFTINFFGKSNDPTPQVFFFLRTNPVQLLRNIVPIGNTLGREVGCIAAYSPTALQNDDFQFF
jgi:hypothetical protein